ncbi:vacuolar protein-sorting-associated protein [Chloropicon primus]|uniref:Vacuolar protein-sorting-associated protein n=1 Tax=Chloropicon primus TaxID=1764295 RepID=A0A5B8MT07_9CHLO|nr:vacuolar protein-sorting-associated protein [Chloropicon primus]UPR01989.1 vacuolar protein-sorting-associated protein [Chloropicon primus]|eukprot:QDZ22765.1 vacuolar protein-sorting-associated protein [Chloropicon primus]
MSGVQPSLAGSVLPLEDIRSQAQRTLISLLDRRPGRKVLVLDKTVSGPLALVANIGVLKEHGVEKLFHLEPGLKVDDGSMKEVVYLVRPTIGNMRLISEQIIEAEERMSKRKDTATIHFSIYFTPRKTVICERILEDCGVLGSLQVDEFPLWLIPFDEDVLSLELNSVFNEVNVEKDFSSLYDVASAIVQLQKVCGLIPKVRGKGESSKVVSNLIQRLALENDLVSASGEAASVSEGGHQIDTLVLLDRSVDLLSPMCTQLTYEGLIDEMLGINNGLVEVPVISQDQEQQQQQSARRGKKVPLNSSDVLFRELRDLNFGSVGPKLRNKTMHMREEYKEINSRTFSEVHQFVKQLNIMPVLDRHTELASLIQERSAMDERFLKRLRCEQDLLDGRGIDSACEYAEELMFGQKASMESVLRLIALVSLVNSGVPKKYYDTLRWGLLHLYGYDNLSTLQSIQHSGLIKKYEGGRNTFPQVKKAFRLVVDEVDDTAPTDISYVYSGYAPLSCRLVDAALKPGGLGSDEAAKMIPGPQFSYEQSRVEEGLLGEGESEDGSGDGRKTVLVVFIGGVTFAEISALRFMSSQGGLNCNFIVMTTKLINGNSLVKSLCSDFGDK